MKHPILFFTPIILQNLIITHLTTYPRFYRAPAIAHDIERFLQKIIHRWLPHFSFSLVMRFPIGIFKLAIVKELD